LGACKKTFFEAVQLNPRDSVATPIVARIDELFAVDAEARRKGLTTAARHIRRQETARTLLDDIHSKIEAAQSFALPSSALSKACQYALTLWRKLTRFLEYPELELSNNLAENSMRPVALGRKNWLPHRQPTSGTEGCGDSLGLGKLPSAASPGARLLFHDSPRAR
jgi:transposase